jgi:hypothetical protein
MRKLHSSLVDSIQETQSESHTYHLQEVSQQAEDNDGSLIDSSHPGSEPSDTSSGPTSKVILQRRDNRTTLGNPNEGPKVLPESLVKLHGSVLHSQETGDISMTEAVIRRRKAPFGDDDAMVNKRARMLDEIFGTLSGNDDGHSFEHPSNSQSHLKPRLEMRRRNRLFGYEHDDIKTGTQSTSDSGVLEDGNEIDKQHVKASVTQRENSRDWNQMQLEKLEDYDFQRRGTLGSSEDEFFVSTFR